MLLVDDVADGDGEDAGGEGVGGARDAEGGGGGCQEPGALVELLAAGYVAEAGGRRRRGGAPRLREVARELHLPPLPPPLAPRGLLRARREPLPAPAAGARHGDDDDAENAVRSVCRFGGVGVLRTEFGVEW